MAVEMFSKSISALIVTISIFFSTEAFAGKRFLEEHNSRKVISRQLKRTQKIHPLKTEKNLKTSNKKCKKPNYKRRSSEKSFSHNRKKDKNVALKGNVVAHKRLKVDQKKKTKRSLRRHVALKRNVVAHKRLRADQKKNAKTSSRPVNPNKLATNDSSNFDNHVWHMKDLGNGYMELTHRVDREMIIYGKRVSTKVPGLPTVFTLPKIQAYAELKRQQDKAKKEPRSAPVVIKKKRRSLRDIFSGR